MPIATIMVIPIAIPMIEREVLVLFLNGFFSIRVRYDMEFIMLNYKLNKYAQIMHTPASLKT
jgi:hypothetical protein